MEIKSSQPLNILMYHSFFNMNSLICHVEQHTLVCGEIKVFQIWLQIHIIDNERTQCALKSSKIIGHF